MMRKITLILFELILNSFIVQSNNANVTQTCETVARLQESFNSQLQTFVKAYNLKIEDLEKQISGNLMNVKTRIAQ
jgi:predicted outer membrane protein